MDAEQFDLETNPIAWRLERKVAHMRENLGPVAWLEMSRQAIRAIQAQLPVFERIKSVTPPGYFHVNLEQLAMLERDYQRFKNAPPDTYSYEDLIDHVVDAEELLVTVNAEMERFNRDYAHFREPTAHASTQPRAVGCAFAAAATASVLTAAAWLAITLT